MNLDRNLFIKFITFFEFGLKNLKKNIFHKKILYFSMVTIKSLLHFIYLPFVKQKRLCTSFLLSFNV